MNAINAKKKFKTDFIKFIIPGKDSDNCSNSYNAILK